VSEAEAASTSGGAGVVNGAHGGAMCVGAAGRRWEGPRPEVSEQGCGCSRSAGRSGATSSTPSLSLSHRPSPLLLELPVCPPACCIFTSLPPSSCFCFWVPSLKASVMAPGGAACPSISLSLGGGSLSLPLLDPYRGICFLLLLLGRGCIQRPHLRLVSLGGCCSLGRLCLRGRLTSLGASKDGLSWQTYGQYDPQMEAPERGGEEKVTPFWCVSTPLAAGVRGAGPSSLGPTMGRGRRPWGDGRRLRRPGVGRAGAVSFIVSA